jgi:uncharacterized membrane protein YfcA
VRVEGGRRDARAIPSYSARDMSVIADPLWLLLLAACMAATGLVSGLLAGLLGVGGGIVIVPVLSVVLPLLGIDPAVQHKLAIATSLATIIPTSIVSARKHHAKGAVDGPLLRSIAVAMVLGTLAGTALVASLRGQTLTLIFAVVALLVAANLGLTGENFRLRDRLPGGAALQAIAAGIGGFSALMGIGGGTLGVPVLAMFGTPIRSAVATASVFGILISIPATIASIFLGWGNPGNPPYSLGYVSLVGVATIAPTSILAAPWGVKLAHSIPPLWLKRAFAVFLVVTAVRMFVAALG